ncbi:MAG TPA: nitroreductase family protein [bacterium]|nr:nitroreductase family protein [bacterium]HOM27752.1 nitroreductase family protein [bacterium]
MEFEDVIKTRRSIRSYNKKEIPEDILKKIFEGTRVAPSGNNKQPWYFIVVKDKDKKSKIAKYSYNQSFIAEADCVVICCGKKYPNPYEPLKDNCYLVDVTIAIDHLILTARNYGVGSCWVGAFYPEPIKKLLKIPQDIDILMIVPLGYTSSEFYESKNRKDLKEFVFKEEFNKPFF